MKLRKAIKLQRKLRIRQEYLCYKVCQYSQNLCSGQSPYFNEFKSVNKAVENVNKKLPWIYFLLSDLFGGASSLRRQSIKYRKEQESIGIKNVIVNLICFDLIANPSTPTIIL